jgi:hypothetical protein
MLSQQPFSLLAGVDGSGGSLALDSERLDEIVDLKGRPGVHHLRLESAGGGAALYAFTSG